MGAFLYVGVFLSLWEFPSNCDFQNNYSIVDKDDTQVIWKVKNPPVEISSLFSPKNIAQKQCEHCFFNHIFESHLEMADKPLCS